MLVALEAASRFDLHLHSNRSDGVLSPQELLEQAAAGGLEALALTDHDLSTGLPPGPTEVGGRVVHVIAGAEMTGVHEGREYHLLVYFPEEVPSSFRDFCTERARARADRYDEAVRNICLPGLDGPSEAAWAGDVALTRHHLARQLVASGHVPTMADAFRTYANDKLVPNVRLEFCEAIRVARKHGGVTSWAHPPKRAVANYLETFVKAGLQGLEGYRPYTSSADRQYVRKQARRHGLFLTGGSDWHGWFDGKPGLFSVGRSELGGFLDTLKVAV